MTSTRWAGWASGAVCALAVLALLSLGGGARSAAPVSTVPDQIAGYSYLTADVSAAPPGRALALYQHGVGVEMLDFPQAVVLAADDDAYRRLDAAEDRAGPETQGDPAPMLLSPDGRWVALGDHDTTSPDLAIVDLETGDVSRRTLPDARSVRPLAWSSDGTQVAYLSAEEPTNPYSGRVLVGSLSVLDLATGDVAVVPGGERASAAAFSPDGDRLAVERRRGKTTSLVLVSPGTDAVRPLAGAGELAGPQAWSPDGRLVMTETPSGFVAVDTSGPTGSERPGLDGLDPGRTSVLGWSDESEVVVADYTEEHARVVAVPLDGGTGRELTRVGGSTNYAVGRLQLATAMLPGLTVRERGPADRGPVPLRAATLIALLCGLASVVVASRLARRRRAES